MKKGKTKMIKSQPPFEETVKEMYYDGYSAVDLMNSITKIIATLEAEKERKRNNLQVLLNDLSHFIEDHYNYKVDDYALDIFANNLIHWLDAANGNENFTINDIVERLGDIEL